MFYKITKRIFDILASGIAIIVLIPLWIVAIIGIELSDPGPVFYLAKRAGKNNVQFKMYKFRSMRVDKYANEKNFKADTDRIFVFGKFMRDYKIDEIPQLINVFMGQMSIIGPRPAAIDQITITRAGKYAISSTLKPGLSSPSALYDYIYGDTIEDEIEYEKIVLPIRLDLDYYYAKNCSISYDIKIIWYTIMCIFKFISSDYSMRILDELIDSSKSVKYKNSINVEE